MMHQQTEPSAAGFWFSFRWRIHEINALLSLIGAACLLITVAVTVAVQKRVAVVRRKDVSFFYNALPAAVAALSANVLVAGSFKLIPGKGHRLWRFDLAAMMRGKGVQRSKKREAKRMNDKVFDLDIKVGVQNAAGKIKSHTCKRS